MICQKAGGKKVSRAPGLSDPRLCWWPCFSGNSLGTGAGRGERERESAVVVLGRAGEVTGLCPSEGSCQLGERKAVASLLSRILTAGWEHYTSSLLFSFLLFLFLFCVRVFRRNSLLHATLDGLPRGLELTELLGVRFRCLASRDTNSTHDT